MEQTQFRTQAARKRLYEQNVAAWEERIIEQIQSEQPDITPEQLNVLMYSWRLRRETIERQAAQEHIAKSR